MNRPFKLIGDGTPAGAKRYKSNADVVARCKIGGLQTFIGPEPLEGFEGSFTPIGPFVITRIDKADNIVDLMPAMGAVEEVPREDYVARLPDRDLVHADHADLVHEVIRLRDELGEATALLREDYDDCGDAVLGHGPNCRRSAGRPCWCCRKTAFVRKNAGGVR